MGRSIDTGMGRMHVRTTASGHSLFTSTAVIYVDIIQIFQKTSENISVRIRRKGNMCVHRAHIHQEITGMSSNTCGNNTTSFQQTFPEAKDEDECLRGDVNSDGGSSGECSSMSWFVYVAS
jgi:hypothetical protein